MISFVTDTMQVDLCGTSCKMWCIVKQELVVNDVERASSLPIRQKRMVKKHKICLKFQGSQLALAFKTCKF